MKKILIASLIFAVVLVYSPVASAQVSYNYQPQSQAETIAYLQGIIAQLQAQLQANGVQYQVQYQYQPTTYRPSGQVLGVSNTFDRGYRLNVGTGFVSIDGDELRLNGTIDLNNAPFGYVWFEFGDDDDFGRRTSRDYVTRDGRYVARIDVDDLDDEYLYYRAVAEGPNGTRDYGMTRAIYVDDNRSGRNSRYNDDEPDVDTFSARDIDEDSAELRGEVDMNDFRNGLVFFVYGEDEDDVEDVDREDEYRDIDQRGDDLRKFIVDSDLDDDEDYTGQVRGLDDDTDYYFRICVEYEDEDDDETLECGDVEEFETDRD